MALNRLDITPSETIRVAVTGVDGSGKTTVIREIQKRFCNSPAEVFAFRAPQYHEDPNLPFGPLSQAIDDLSVLADRTSDPVESVRLKCLALFLSMTLYGDVERHILSTYRPKVLFAERQCLLDTLAYASFYIPLLKNTSSKSDLKNELNHDLKSKGLFKLPEGIERWISVVAQREPALQLVPENFSEYLKQVFSGNSTEVVARLQRIFSAEIPDRILILTTSPENLAERLAEKKATTPTELHEKAEVLSRLLNSLREVSKLLQMMKPSLIVTEINTEKLSISETVAEVLNGSSRNPPLPAVINPVF